MFLALFRVRLCWNEGFQIGNTAIRAKRREHIAVVTSASYRPQYTIDDLQKVTTEYSNLLLMDCGNSLRVNL